MYRIQSIFLFLVQSQVRGTPFKMKVLLTVAFTLFLLIGCQKNEDKDPVVTLSVSPSEVDYGGSVTVSWESFDALHCTLNGSKVENSGSLTKTLVQTTIFEIVAHGEETDATATATVTVILPDAPSISLISPSEVIRYGDKATYSWEVSGVYTSITLDGVGITAKDTKTTSMLFETEEHTIVAEGPGGKTTKTFKLNVGDYTTSPFGLLTYNSLTWTLVKDELIRRDDESLIAEFNLINEKYTFYKDFKYKYEFVTSVYTRTWEFRDNEKKIYCGAEFIIKELTKDILVLYYINTFETKDGKIIDVYDKKTYTHK